jgi:hypothetical protein
VKDGEVAALLDVSGEVELEKLLRMSEEVDCERQKSRETCF